MRVQELKDSAYLWSVGAKVKQVFNSAGRAIGQEELHSDRMHALLLSGLDRAEFGAAGQGGGGAAVQINLTL